MEPESQAASAVLMIRPVRFSYNEETARDNSFQHNGHLPDDEMQRLALGEFNNYVRTLQSKGIEVVVFDDTYEPHKPDSIFPNNWVSFHQDGTVILYPMEAEDRRTERRQDIIDDLERKYNFQVNTVIDISAEEENGRFLESTGSLIFDYPNKIAYACLSQRTNKELAELICNKLGYKLHAFESVDNEGHPIYHTNVMMCVGEKFVMIWMESIKDPKEREDLLLSFEATNKEIIYLTCQNILDFAGNALEVSNKEGQRFLLIAQQGYDSLSPAQRAMISKYTEMVPLPLDVIEGAEGGSARCMVADIRLPKHENKKQIKFD